MSFYIKWVQNYVEKLHSMTKHVLMSWFKTKNTETTERWKTGFPKETAENADLHKAVWKQWLH